MGRLTSASHSLWPDPAPDRLGRRPITKELAPQGDGSILHLMRATTALLSAAVLLLGGLAGDALAGAALQRHAALTIVRMGPVTVRGTGFRPSERVVLQARTTTASTTRRATAGASGAFTAALPGIAVGRCGGLSITATGARGSRASVVRHVALPGCNAA